MSGYQGYKNWETWNLALWLSQDDDEYLTEAAGQGGSAVEEYVLQMLDEQISNLPGGWIGDVVNMAINEVDWDELAEHFKDEDEPEDDEDESTFEEQYENEQFAQDGDYHNLERED